MMLVKDSAVERVRRRIWGSPQHAYANELVGVSSVIYAQRVLGLVALGKKKVTSVAPKGIAYAPFISGEADIYIRARRTPIWVQWVLDVDRYAGGKRPHRHTQLQVYSRSRAVSDTGNYAQPTPRSTQHVSRLGPTQP